MSEVESAEQPRRKGRWLPRGAVVFLLVAAVLFVVFVFIRPDWLTGDPDDAPTELRFEKDLTAIGRADGVRLSDDNATSQTFSMTLPVDSELRDVTLALVGTTTAAEDSTVFLRVLADGQSVLVTELEAGDHDLDTVVDLPDSVADDGAVQIQVRTTGSLDQRRCNITEEVGALVWLDPGETRVYGTLSDPIRSIRDAAAGLDQNVALDLAFPAGDREWYETAARYGALLTQAGHEVTYRDVTSESAGDDLPDFDGSRVLLGPADALTDLGWEPRDPGGDAAADEASVQVGSVDDVADLAVVQPSDVAPTFLTTAAAGTADTGSSSPRSATPETLSGETVTLESLGVDTSVQQLTTSRTWRATYSLADLPTGTAPTQARLRLMVPPTSDDARWLVQAQLNDRLIDSQLLRDDGAGVGGVQEVRVPIPGGLELVRNELSVTLVRDRDLGGCNVRQTTYPVQLLPTSTLRLGGTGAGFTAVPSQFTDGFDVLVPAASADDPAASLADLTPTLAEFSSWEQDLTFRWDGAPGGRPFLLLGDPSPGVTGPVAVADGRIVGRDFDLQSFQDGVVVQCVTSGTVPGVVVTAVGEPGDTVPPYGRESARLVAGDGGGFVVSDSGRIVTAPPVRADTGG